MKVFIEEQADRMCREWAYKIAYKSDETASRFNGYDKLSYEEMEFLSSEIFTRTLQKMAREEFLTAAPRLS